MTDASRVSLPGPSLTWTGRLVLAGAAGCLVAFERVPPTLAIVAAGAVLVDAVLAIVLFRPGRLAVAVPATGTLESAIPCRVAHDGLHPDTILRIDRARDRRHVFAGEPGTTELQAVPPARGIYLSLSVAGTLVGPLGLAAVQRRWHIPLPRALAVTPAPVRVAMPERPAAADPAAARSARRGDERGDQLREHQPGDSVRAVHWPVSERHDELIVRTGERPAPRICVGVDLSGGDPDGIVAAAMSVIQRWRSDGHPVRLWFMVDRSPDDVMAELAGPARRPSPYRASGGAPDMRPGVGVAEFDIATPVDLALALAAAVTAPLPPNPAVDAVLDRALLGTGSRP